VKEALKMRIAALAAAALCAALVLAATEKPGELQAHFDHETNAVHKAKLLEKLGEAQFDETRRAGAANDYNTVGIILEKYRDNVRAALDALKKQHPDAERQSNGYRQLEIHVRKSIREIDEILLLAPEPLHPPILLVRADLASFDDEMLALLFPKRPAPPTPAAPAASAASPSTENHQ
jgi:hypothetical protein